MGGVTKPGCILKNLDKPKPNQTRPLGPGVGALPAARLHKKRAPDWTGWFVRTRGSCQPCQACDSEQTYPRPGLKKDPIQTSRAVRSLLGLTCIYE